MEKQNLKNKAYQLIREKIVNCDYEPGAILSESQLMGEVGSSRTPIREALNRLEQEDLVRIYPKRGILVSEVTTGIVNSVYEIRNLIEPYIVEHYAALIPKEQIKAEINRIEKANDADSMVVSEAASMDDDLHQMLMNASNNTYVVDMMNKVYAQNHRIRILSTVNVENRYSNTQNEHLEILQYILNDEIQDAVEAMKRHLNNSKAAAVEAMLAGNIAILRK